MSKPKITLFDVAIFPQKTKFSVLHGTRADERYLFTNVNVGILPKKHRFQQNLRHFVARYTCLWREEFQNGTALEKGQVVRNQNFFYNHNYYEINRSDALNVCDPQGKKR